MTVFTDDEINEAVNAARSAMWEKLTELNPNAGTDEASSAVVSASIGLFAFVAECFGISEQEAVDMYRDHVRKNRKNGVCSLQHTLYSFVPTNFGSQPARNWICEGSEEYCLEVLNKLQNTNET
jgi:hypothetical protein